MKRLGLVLIGVCALLAVPASDHVAQEAPEDQTDPQASEPPPRSDAGVRLSLAVIASGVEAREPVGQGDRFPADIGQVYCYTRVEGASEETVIYHAWRQGDKLHAKVQLNIRGPSWRTWSSKRILPAWTGDWTVDIEDADGNVLDTLQFTIDPVGG